jgi:CrcB protein
VSAPDWLTHPVVLLTVGGGVGTNARYWLGRAVAHFQRDAAFPWATFLINVTGSALLGLCAAAYLNDPDPARKNWYLLLGTGFCGGFTTFSTFSLETLTLLHDGRPWTAAAYALGSVACGLVAVWMALRLAR